MTHELKAVLIEPNQRSEIVFSLAHHKTGHTLALFATEHQKNMFQDVLLSVNHPNLHFNTFQEYLNQKTQQTGSVVIMDVPRTFQLMESLLAVATQNQQIAYLVLLRIDKKYLQILSKKVSVNSTILTFSANKFIGINDKIRQLVDKSYDINRAAFYAYGAYINYYRANMLTRIFRTSQIDVEKLARSYGFTTPPRVKEGNFLTKQAQLEKKKAKKAAKKKEIAAEKEQQVVETKQQKVKAKTAEPKQAKRKLIKKKKTAA